MKLQAHHWLFALTIGGLWHASYFWGGLALIDDIGPIAERSAEREGALTWTYMQAGRAWIKPIGWEDAARLNAELTFAPSRKALLTTPRAAMDLLHSEPANARHRVLRWTHLGTPILLLLSGIAYLRRQKPIVTTRRLR